MANFFKKFVTIDAVCYCSANIPPMTLLECATTQDFLSLCLQERQLRNSRYSLRKFARDLGLSPSAICEVLKGRKRLSEDATLKVISRLKLNPQESKYFDLICAFDRCRNPELRKILRNKIQDFLKECQDTQQNEVNLEQLIGTETLAIDEKDIPQIKALADHFFKAVINLTNSSTLNKQFYTIGVQAFKHCLKIET